MSPGDAEEGDGVCGDSLAPGQEALLVGHKAGCGGDRQEGGHSKELEETTD